MPNQIDSHEVNDCLYSGYINFGSITIPLKILEHINFSFNYCVNFCISVDIFKAGFINRNKNGDCNA